ncbi:MAG: DUF5839 family protein [bacterium]
MDILEFDIHDVGEKDMKTLSMKERGQAPVIFTKAKIDNSKIMPGNILEIRTDDGIKPYLIKSVHREASKKTNQDIKKGKVFVSELKPR